jgi:hypothetical protein
METDDVKENNSQSKDEKQKQNFEMTLSNKDRLERTKDMPSFCKMIKCIVLDYF